MFDNAGLQQASLALRGGRLLLENAPIRIQSLQGQMAPFEGN